MAGDRPPHINAPPLQRTAGKQKARQTEKTVCRACMLSAVPRLHGFAVPRKLVVSRVLGLGGLSRRRTPTRRGQVFSCLNHITAVNPLVI